LVIDRLSEDEGSRLKPAVRTDCCQLAHQLKLVADGESARSRLTSPPGINMIDPLIGTPPDGGKE
jgi:hypothetical protein